MFLSEKTAILKIELYVAINLLLSQYPFIDFFIHSTYLLSPNNVLGTLLGASDMSVNEPVVNPCPARADSRVCSIYNMRDDYTSNIMSVCF